MLLIVHLQMKFYITTPAESNIQLLLQEVIMLHYFCRFQRKTFEFLSVAAENQLSSQAYQLFQDRDLFRVERTDSVSML